MGIKQVSMDEMMKRVARMKDLKSTSKAFVDTRLPENQREIFDVIGGGVTEDPDSQPEITDPNTSSNPRIPKTWTNGPPARSRPNRMSTISSCRASTSAVKRTTVKYPGHSTPKSTRWEPALMPCSALTLVTGTFRMPLKSCPSPTSSSNEGSSGLMISAMLPSRTRSICTAK